MTPAPDMEVEQLKERVAQLEKQMSYVSNALSMSYIMHSQNISFNEDNRNHLDRMFESLVAYLSTKDADR